MQERFRSIRASAASKLASVYRARHAEALALIRLPVGLWSEGGDGPALLPEAPSDCPVLSQPDAMFQPAVDPAHIQTEGTGQREAGQLRLAADRWLLVVGDGGGTPLTDMSKG